jgi:hypothetical protein
VGGVPGVVGDLPDLEQQRIGENALLDRAVIDDIPWCRLDEALPGPAVVGHPIPLGTLVEILLGHEVARQHVPEVVIVLGREHPGERGNIGRGREVEPAEAQAPAELLEVDRSGAGVPDSEVDPAFGLLGPLVEVHAPEGVLGAGQGDRLLGLRARSSSLTKRPKLGFALRQTFGPVHSSPSSAEAMYANQLSSRSTPSRILIA